MNPSTPSETERPPSTRLRKVFFGGALKLVLTATLLALAVVADATTQTYSVLHSFGVLTNVTGREPQAALAQAPDGTLYGTTSRGEGTVAGTVFKLNSDGTGFTVLKRFTNSLEGAHPSGGLVLSGSTLYGTTRYGGSSDFGTVFKVNTNGGGYTVLKNFTETNGAYPRAGLTLSGSTLYGTTSEGGSSNYGTVFQLSTDGSGFTVLMNFTTESHFAGSEGGNLQVGLTLSGSTLYGTTSSAGGTVFQFNTDGGGFTVLKNFTGPDGAYPKAGVTLSGSTLYGTTFFGGSSIYVGGLIWNSYGTVFKVNTDGSDYAVLKNFTRSDGAHPGAGLTLSSSTLYGTTSQGGSSGRGTVFKVNTDGSGYTVLKNLTGSDGANPSAGLTLFGSTLYGTTSEGGSGGAGVVFSLSLQPLLTLALSGANVILTWPTNVTGFTLQSTTNPGSSGWSTVSPAPVIVNGQYTVAHPISGAQQFYRLTN